MIDIESFVREVGPLAHITFNGHDGMRHAHTIPSDEFFAWRIDDPSAHVHIHGSAQEARAAAGRPNIGTVIPMEFTPVVNRKGRA